MCGLMAFAGDVDPGMVQSLADQARRRGPDSIGVAWGGADGVWTLNRRRTLSWPEAVMLEVPPGARAGIAHARLATSDGESQPLLIEDMVFAHNGTVYRHEEVAAHWGLKLSTGNDSEVLGRLFRLFGYDASGAVEALKEHQDGIRHAFMAASGRKIWIASFGQPLYYRAGARGNYACSWRFQDSVELGFGSILVWSL
jgi:asparagine synthetase B (glutamine-hydrolysing)